MQDCRTVFMYVIKSKIRVPYEILPARRVSAFAGNFQKSELT